MEEQFILRVPPSVAERIERLLNEDSSSEEDKSLDLSFLEDGRSGTFVIGGDSFPASLLDLPTVVESYKTYDDTNLVKTADIGQIIMVREPGDPAPDVVEYRHGLTPPMRDARKRRFRREPDLNPELVRRVEKDLLNIMAGGTAEAADILAKIIAFSIPFCAARLKIFNQSDCSNISCLWTQKAALSLDVILKSLTCMLSNSLLKKKVLPGVVVPNRLLQLKIKGSICHLLINWLL